MADYIATWNIIYGPREDVAWVATAFDLVYNIRELRRYNDIAEAVGLKREYDNRNSVDYFEYEIKKYDGKNQGMVAKQGADVKHSNDTDIYYIEFQTENAYGPAPRLFLDFLHKIAPSCKLAFQSCCPTEACLYDPEHLFFNGYEYALCGTGDEWEPCDDYTEAEMVEKLKATFPDEYAAGVSIEELINMAEYTGYGVFVKYEPFDIERDE